LGGITRELILELAAQHQLMCEEKVLTEQDVMTADEVWITSSTREIFPIVQVNDQKIGEGVAGPMWHKMISHYRDFIEALK